MKRVWTTVGTFLAMAAMAAVVGVLLFRRGGEEKPAPHGAGSSQGRHGGEGVVSLIVVSPHQEGIRMEFGRAFSHWHKREFGTTVEIDWIDIGGTTKDEQYVKASFARRPEGGDFDIFFGGGTDPYLTFTELGITLPFRLPEKELSRLPKEIGGVPLYDPSCKWYGTSLTSFGILYNKVVLKRLGMEAPEKWEDLADPKFFGLVSLADPRYSGSMRMMFEIILQGYGWEKGFELIIRMGANAASFVPNSSQSAREVTLGEAACGLAIDFYAWAEIEEVGRDKMGFVMPKGLTVMNPDCIAILKGATQVEVAKRFVTFVMSEAGQRLWILPVGAPGGPKEHSLRRMALLPSVYTRYRGETLVAANPFDIEMAMKYDRKKGSARWNILNALIGAMVIDTHDDLKKAYKALIDRGMPEKYLRVLTRIPLTEEAALEIARTKWQDSRERARLTAEWTDESRSRLMGIIRDLR